MEDIPVHFQKRMELQKRGKTAFCGAEKKLKFTFE
jgi:hypothetical protein